MKTLAQIEPRTPISSVPFNITTSGSYYLTTNLTVTTGDCIDINANGVTIDLNGFTISSTDSGNTGTGIYLAAANGNTDVTILNGHITSGVTYNAGTFSGPGFLSGITYALNPPYNIRVSGVSVSGCLANGIALNQQNSTVVESCTVKSIGSTGISADCVFHCTAKQCGAGSFNWAIYAVTASDCRAEATGSASGIYTTTANNCYGTSISGNGLSANSAANNCSGSSTSGTGLNAAVALNCTGSSGSGIGLAAQMANNCVGSTTGSGTALSVTGSAIGCYGSSGSGIAITAHIANSCSVGSGSTNLIYQYNMP